MSKELHEELSTQVRGILNFMDAAWLLWIVSVDRLVRFVVGRKDGFVFDVELIGAMATQYVLAYWQGSHSSSWGTVEQLVNTLQSSKPEQLYNQNWQTK